MILKLIQEMGYTLISIAKGMSVTWRNLFRTKQTIQFPTEQLVLPPIYRGGGMPPAHHRQLAAGVGVADDRRGGSPERRRASRVLRDQGANPGF